MRQKFPCRKDGNGLVRVLHGGRGPLHITEWMAWASLLSNRAASSSLGSQPQPRTHPHPHPPHPPHHHLRAEEEGARNQRWAFKTIWISIISFQSPGGDSKRDFFKLRHHEWETMGVFSNRSLHTAIMIDFVNRAVDLFYSFQVVTGYWGEISKNERRCEKADEDTESDPVCNWLVFKSDCICVMC